MTRNAIKFLLIASSLSLFVAVAHGDYSYTIRAGDTLWSIAARELKDGRRWEEIALRNGITSPSNLKTGMTIVIPELNSETAQFPTESFDAAPTPDEPEHPIRPAPDASASADEAIHDTQGLIVVEKWLPRVDRPATTPAEFAMSGPLTLDQATAIALAHAPEIAAAQARIRAATAATGIVKADGLPQVNAGANLERLETFKTTSTLGIDELSFGGDLAITQSLFTFGRLSTAIQAATADEAAALAGSAQAEATVRHAVHAAYLNYLLAEKTEYVAEQSRDVSARLLHEASIREREGVGTQFDVTRANANLAAKISELAKARAATSIAREAVASAMGVSPSTSFAIEGDLSVLPQPVTAEAALDLALVERPELAVLAHQLQAAGYRVDNARAQGRPSIDASIGAEYTRHEFITASSFFQGQDASSARAGLGLTVPIFDGHRVRESVKQRRAQLDEVVAQYDRAALDARTEIRGIYYDLIASLEALESSERGVIASEEALRISQISFREGIVSALDVIEASFALAQARGALFSAEFDYHSGIARLIRAAGSNRVIQN